MKFNLTSGFLFLVLGPAAAGPLAERKLDDRMDASAAAVMPISIDGSQPRNPLRLREVLRQPFDSMDDPYEPYRLSPEERQRMREQLRSQRSQANHTK